MKLTFSDGRVVYPEYYDATCTSFRIFTIFNVAGPVRIDITNNNGDPAGGTFTVASSAPGFKTTSYARSASDSIGLPMTSESIVVAYSQGTASLATGDKVATGTPLPTELLGTIIKVKDSTGFSYKKNRKSAANV